MSTIKRSNNRHLTYHIIIVCCIYFFATFVVTTILGLPESLLSLTTLLSNGAMIATFGSALGAIGLIWQADLKERIFENIDILFKDIIKQELKWRRWPFLPRTFTKKTKNGDVYHQVLTNPDIDFEIENKSIKIDVPTVLDDLFDLPLLKNYWHLKINRDDAYLKFLNSHGNDTDPNKLQPYDEHMAFECLYDVWLSILKFRVSRYIVHLGIALTLIGIISTIIHAFIYNQVRI